MAHRLAPAPTRGRVNYITAAVRLPTS